MNPLTWLLDKWYTRLRDIDMTMLWPTCMAEAKRQGLTIDHACAAFAYHAFHDKAWLVLGEAEIFRRIDALREANK
jgi:hypothetical protein